MKGVLTCITGCCMGKGGIKKVLIYQYVLVKRPLWDWDMGVLPVVTKSANLSLCIG